jgi:hypothetical protein
MLLRGFGAGLTLAADRGRIRRTGRLEGSRLRFSLAAAATIAGIAARLITTRGIRWSSARSPPATAIAPRATAIAAVAA